MPLASLYGLPKASSTAEELRIVTLLTATRGGLSFSAIAAEAPDAVAVYEALFALLTRGRLAAVESEDGTVDYRLRRRRMVGPRSYAGQLSLAA